MHLHTLRKSLQTASIKVTPAKPNSGITLNGVLACPRYVVRGDTCVVLRDGANFAFVTEHPLAALRMCGIHDATVEGIEANWDFARPQHRAAYALMLKPSAIVGGPDGTISAGLIELINENEIVDSGTERDEVTVAERVHVTTEDGGKLEINPALKGTGLDIELCLANLGPLRAMFDPEEGLKPDELKSRVSKSVTAFIKGPTEDSLYHALGDMIGDLAGVGGIDNATIKAKFMRLYHRLTMTAVKRIRLVPTD
nr:UDP-3-O-acyl-N-acetylglucosamine deacetylase [Candidatus Njordarchaeota archaeon]